MHILLIVLSILAKKVTIEADTGKIEVRGEREYQDKLTGNEYVVLYKHRCPYSEEALKLMISKGFSFSAYERMNDEKFTDYIKKNYHETFPAIFHKGRIIGGFVDLKKEVENTGSDGVGEGNFSFWF